MFAMIYEDPKAPCLSVVLPRTDMAASQDWLPFGGGERPVAGEWPDTRVTFHKVSRGQGEGSVDKVLAMQTWGPEFGSPELT